MTAINPFDGTTHEEFPPEHYQAIGKFITMYSMIESFFHDIFALYSGLDSDTSRAIMGGMRMKDVIERIKRLIKLRELDPRILLDIEQIDTLIDPLSQFRDKIVHRVWLQSDRGPVLLNLSGAKSMATITQESVSTEDLNQKTRETLEVALRVMPHAITDTQWEAMPDLFRSMMQAPWRDKLL